MEPKSENGIGKSRHLSYKIVIWRYRKINEISWTSKIPILNINQIPLVNNLIKNLSPRLQEKLWRLQ